VGNLINCIIITLVHYSAHHVPVAYKMGGYFQKFLRT